MYECAIKTIKKVKVVAICDVNEKRCEELAAKVEESGQTRPEVYGDYKECLDRAKPQAAVVSTAWEKHLEITE